MLVKYKVRNGSLRPIDDNNAQEENLYEKDWPTILEINDLKLEIFSSKQ